MKDLPMKLLLGAALSIALWTVIFLIQAAVGYFMPPILIGATAAISGVIIERYIASR